MTQCRAANSATIADAAHLLRDGALVAFGTETVYGLGADATNPEAVARIFAAKDRPRFNPLIIHAADPDTAFAWVRPTAPARRLAERFWPGPLTLVLPRAPDCPVALLAGAGLDTLAVRVPAHPDARALLRATGRPVAAPSANRSGRVSPTTAQHVLDGLAGRVALVLDSGPCPVGVESTVLDLSGETPRLLRPGGVTAEALAPLCGDLLGFPADNPAPRSPGQLSQHYAPLCPLRLDAAEVAADEALLAFGPPLPGAGAVFALSDSSSLEQAAARLFEGLRALEAMVAERRLRGIAAMAVPRRGLGTAINDRLHRAASSSQGASNRSAAT